MSNTTPCGLDGNIGFPYSFTGELLNENLTQITTPITFSFGDTKTTPTLMRETGSVVLNSSNTIIYNGTKYDMGHVQACQPHSLWSLKDKNIVAEIVFTFITKDKETKNPLTIILSYLIEKSAKGDDNNEFLNSMFSGMPPRKNINIMDLCTTSPSHFLYFTCIPYLEKGKNIGGLRSMCIVGQRPIKVNSERLKQLNLRKYRLPSTLLLTNDRQTIISYSIKSAGMSNPITSPTGETFHNSINVSDASFAGRFKTFTFVKKTPTPSKKTRTEGFIDLTEGFAGKQEGGNEAGATTNESARKSDEFIKLDELKCYPVNQRTDINGDILLIDPATGKRMDAYLKDADAMKGPGEVEVPEKNHTFAYVLGLIGGLLIGTILISIGIAWVFKSSSEKIVKTAVDTVAKTTAAAATKDISKQLLISAAATTLLTTTPGK
jgi:hypothetical protein